MEIRRTRQQGQADPERRETETRTGISRGSPDGRPTGRVVPAARGGLGVPAGQGLRQLGRLISQQREELLEPRRG